MGNVYMSSKMVRSEGKDFEVVRLCLYVSPRTQQCLSAAALIYSFAKYK
jgi:hypothetical protein